jgi:hypothetical protein
MIKESPREFRDFLQTCDESDIDPFTAMREKLHHAVDNSVNVLEAKYSTGRTGKTWADLADEVYDDVKKGYDELSKAAADWYYGE